MNSNRNSPNIYPQSVQSAVALQEMLKTQVLPLRMFEPKQVKQVDGWPYAHVAQGSLQLSEQAPNFGVYPIAHVWQ